MLPGLTYCGINLKYCVIVSVTFQKLVVHFWIRHKSGVCTSSSFELMVVPATMVFLLFTILLLRMSATLRVMKLGITPMAAL